MTSLVALVYATETELLNNGYTHQFTRTNYTNKLKAAVLNNTNTDLKKLILLPDMISNSLRLRWINYYKYNNRAGADMYVQGLSSDSEDSTVQPGI